METAEREASAGRSDQEGDTVTDDELRFLFVQWRRPLLLLMILALSLAKLLGDGGMPNW